MHRSKQTIAPPDGLENAPEATFMPRQRVGRLDSVANWRRELSRLYRKMRSGEIPADIGTKLAYVAGVAAKLVQIEQELAEAKRIADALEQHRNPIARLDLASVSTDASGAVVGELVSADRVAAADEVSQ